MIQFVILGPKSRLQNRLLFHLSHKFGDEKRLMGHHQSLQDIIEDQLSLASIHYLRSHYQEAIDIYKRILLDNRHVYIYVFEIFWFFSINSFKITDFIGNIFWQVNKKKSDKYLCSSKC